MQVPLSEKLRPKSFKDLFGQEHLTNEKSWMQSSIKNNRPHSMLLFAPPGTGKTTIAKLYGHSFKANFITLSAVFSGVKDLKEIINDAKNNPLFKSQTILFVDEIHRFNKAQQDAFLPFLEDGTLILIGATTENPSFSLNNALLSRLRVVTLNSLNSEDLKKILLRYETEISKLNLSEEAEKFLIETSQGDARHLLNMIENLEDVKDGVIDIEKLQKIIQKKPALYDKHSDGHYHLISALHKSIRGSDPDASLYWLCRMLEGGEEPLYICRRLIRMAAEDIGLADPQAIQITLSARETYRTLGSPEGELSIAQAVVYLALAPKSNAIYVAYEQAKTIAANTNSLSPPNKIINATSKLMKDLGHGNNYKYDHDEADCFSGQNYFPDQLPRQSFYQPKLRGFEREMKKRIDYFSKLRQKKEN